MSHPARFLAATLVVALLSCASPDGADDAATEDGSAAALVAAAGPQVEGEPELDDEVGIFEDATLDSCDSGPGAVEAAGTVTNGADDEVDVVVTIRWVRAEGNNVLERARAVLEDLAPGEERSWSVEAELSDGDEETVCSMRVLAGSLR